MTELFYTILNMSISASVLVLVVLLLRLLFRKAPKWVAVLLWGLVAVRLLCPFALETPFSLMPKTEWITEDTSYSDENAYFDNVAPEYITPDPNFADNVNVHYYPLEPHIEIHRGVNPVFVLNCVWLAGIAVMLVYMFVSYICVYRRINGAKQFKDNIYTSESVSSPFVLGLVRPRIYLPENMDAISMSYVIAHEEAHLRRLDHLWKPIGFLLLAVHWFNPLIWIGYILLCRDIEMACDERVVRSMNDEERVDYSEALLECSVSRKMITACPLAFGEVGAKQRIMSVLNYKKPAFWIILLAVIACIVTAVCFLTNPIAVRNPWVQEYIVGAEGILGQVDKEKYESVHEDFAIGADKYGRAVFKNPLKAFDTMKKLYTDGLTLIAEEQELAPISQSNYNLYKKFGWQITSGSEEAQKQARFVTNFLDIYENSFDKEKPNTDLPAPTMEGDSTTDEIIPSNVSEETLNDISMNDEEISADNSIVNTVMNFVKSHITKIDIGLDSGSYSSVDDLLKTYLSDKEDAVESTVPKFNYNLDISVKDYQDKDTVIYLQLGLKASWNYVDDIDSGYGKLIEVLVNKEDGKIIDVYDRTNPFDIAVRGDTLDLSESTVGISPDIVRTAKQTYLQSQGSGTKPPVEFTAVIKAFDTDAWENGEMQLNIVEYITRDDTERIAELELSDQDMISSYYIHDEDESITLLKMPEDTEYIFFDWSDAYTDETDERYEILGERWISTRNTELFYEYWLPYADSPGYPFVFTASEEKVIVKEIPLM